MAGVAIAKSSWFLVSVPGGHALQMINKLFPEGPTSPGPDVSVAVGPTFLGDNGETTTLPWSWTPSHGLGNQLTTEEATPKEPDQLVQLTEELAAIMQADDFGVDHAGQAFDKVGELLQAKYRLRTIKADKEVVYDEEYVGSKKALFEELNCQEAHGQYLQYGWGAVALYLLLEAYKVDYLHWSKSFFDFHNELMTGDSRLVRSSREVVERGLQASAEEAAEVVSDIRSNFDDSIINAFVKPSVLDFVSARAKLQQLLSDAGDDISENMLVRDMNLSLMMQVLKGDMTLNDENPGNVEAVMLQLAEIQVNVQTEADRDLPDRVKRSIESGRDGQFDLDMLEGHNATFRLMKGRSDGDYDWRKNLSPYLKAANIFSDKQNRLDDGNFLLPMILNCRWFPVVMIV